MDACQCTDACVHAHGDAKVIGQAGKSHRGVTNKGSDQQVRIMCIILDVHLSEANPDVFICAQAMYKHTNRKLKQTVLRIGTTSAETIIAETFSRLLGSSY